MDIDLRGRTAFVSGSTKGIGHAIAAGLARAGASTIVNGRTEDSVTGALDALRTRLPEADLRGVVAEVARRHGRTPRQVALNFLTRRPSLFTIPKASRAEHVRENAGALDFTLLPDDVAAIDAAFPA